MTLMGFESAFAAIKIAADLGAVEPDCARCLEAIAEKNTTLDHRAVASQGMTLMGFESAFAAIKIAADLRAVEPDLARRFEAIPEQYCTICVNAISLKATDP